MSTKTNTGLVAYAKAQVGLPYWYGTYGQTANASLYGSKKKQYPDYYTDDDYSSQYGKRVHDCCGLIKGYLWSDSATGTPTYNSAQDKSASGMYSAAKTKGKIATFPGTAGLLLFKGTAISKITHVGVYGGDGYVYEAKGHAYGVTKTNYSASDWNYWAQCSYITDDTADADTGSGTADESKTSGATVSSGGTATNEVTATAKAASLDKTIAGTYKTTANLHLRDGAGTGKTSLVVLPKSTKVQNYGYYTKVSGVKWLYVQVTYNDIKYTGFCCGTYLSKQ